MSQRLGPANGRCITSYESPRILNDKIMAENGIDFLDNYSYRKFLQSKGPEGVVLPFANGACGRPLKNPVDLEE